MLSTEDDLSFQVYHTMFSAVSAQGAAYENFISVSGLDPELSTDLYMGAECIGWTYFLVDKEDSAPLAAMDRKSASEIWFQLRY